MSETVAARGRRVRVRCARVGVPLLALALLGAATACSREPSEKDLRAEATSPAARARRAAAERTADDLVRRLGAVGGLEHVLTRTVDTCAMPYDGSVFERTRSPDSLECGMRTEAYFGVRTDMPHVLARVRAARIADWGAPQDPDGNAVDSPTAAGSVAYALVYHRDHGRYGDGSLMPAPALEAPGLRIDWDRPHMPLPNLLAEPAPCPAAGSAVYRRCLTSPAAPAGVAAARSRFGTVLVLRVGGRDSAANEYFTVRRAP
ncbi:hypothetical protein ACIQU5_07465 [Streptomyces sp. NPDC090306]|uniref:hypothetical protein n=1 Tax=Streptomyces sp. NPDC090306 TaxID=3365961 RepID=UPI0037FB4321